MAESNSIRVVHRKRTVGKFKHPAYGTGAYRSYHAMMTRCYNAKQPRYINYGGRGIKVCERWLQGFRFFFEDMGQRPNGMTLDRRDTDGDYTPENCRWATAEEQRNNKQDSVFLTHGGERKTIAQWAGIVGLPDCVIRTRLNLGWSAVDALMTPSAPGSNQHGRGEIVEFEGQSMTWHDWAIQIGINYFTLKKRMESGWEIERTLTHPLRPHKRK